MGHRAPGGWGPTWRMAAGASAGRMGRSSSRSTMAGPTACQPTAACCSHLPPCGSSSPISTPSSHPRTFAAGPPKLDVLVNNAGIATRTRQLSADGHELTWATNFLGPFLLTRALLPTLKRARHPRVVSVSSAAHFGAQIPWDDVELEHGFRPFKAYAQTKLAQVLFTRELAGREPGIAVTAVHPGAIATDIWRAAPLWARLVLKLVFASARKG